MTGEVAEGNNEEDQEAVYTNKEAFHSRQLAKTNILGIYISAWCSIMGYSMPKWKELLYIDGFAGAGAFKDRNNEQDYEGSPVAVVKKIVNHERFRKTKVKLHVVCVEKDVVKVNALKTRLDSINKNGVTIKYTILHGEFDV